MHRRENVPGGATGGTAQRNWQRNRACSRHHWSLSSLTHGANRYFGPLGRICPRIKPIYCSIRAYSHSSSNTPRSYTCSPRTQIVISSHYQWKWAVCQLWEYVPFRHTSVSTVCIWNLSKGGGGVTTGHEVPSGSASHQWQEAHGKKGVNLYMQPHVSAIEDILCFPCKSPPARHLSTIDCAVSTLHLSSAGYYHALTRRGDGIH